MKKILISFPTDPANMYIHKKVSMLQWILAKDSRYNVIPMWPTHRPYENNLHHIVNDFMEGNYDFWLNIDADNPPLRNPLDLVELNRDIIGLPTPVWYFADIKGDRPIYWNSYDYVSNEDAYREHNLKIGLQLVDAVGTGCFLVSRRVFLNDNMRKGTFMRKWNEDGTVYKGNDIMFCERARKEGFEIYCHYDYPCDHFAELSLNEITQSIQNLAVE